MISKWVGVALLLAGGVAQASPWSVTVGLGAAIPSNAQSGAQAEVNSAAGACGCTVTGHADIRAPFGSLGVGYRVNRWIAVAASGFSGPTFNEHMVLTGGGTTAPATIRDRISGGAVLALAHHRFAGRWAWAVGAGLAVTRDSESGSITVNGTTTTFPADVTTRVSPAVSATVLYLVNRRWSLGVSYLEIPTVGSKGNQYTAGPLGLASVTAGYSF